MDERNIHQAPPSNQHPHDRSPVVTQPKQNSNVLGPGETGYVPIGVAEHERLHTRARSLQSSGTPVINKPSFEEEAGTVASARGVSASLGAPVVGSTLGDSHLEGAVGSVASPPAVAARDSHGRLTHDAHGNELHYVGDTDQIAL